MFNSITSHNKGNEVQEIWHKNNQWKPNFSLPNFGKTIIISAEFSKTSCTLKC